jgi:uncharacterized protein (TIGR02466 family)|tara:strand:+ start:2163 stop:2756 length:594 start_codon:yes stop_codon:yes gene_type:complete
MNIETWFPTLIGQEILEDHKKIAKKITPVCKKIKKQIPAKKNTWVSKLYQTCATHDICKDKNFDTINNIIYKKVNEYVQKIGSKQSISYKEGWFNFYKKYDFQEFHCHPARQLSVIYVLKSTRSDPKIIFERDQGLYNMQDEVDTDAFTPKVEYKSVQGNLIIFRSSLHHCVEMQTHNEERISLAYNFSLTKKENEK